MHATGITLSQNQYEHVTRAIAARGLAGRVEVRMRDYLDLPEDELYDKIASVGMFEHVGVARFPTYFGKIHRVLKPGGFVLNHGITHNELHGASLGSGIGEFVEEYVFPGGELTHVHRVDRGRCRPPGLETIDAEALREHYARTLWHWIERLEANAEAARARGGRRALPRLAHLHGRLGARVRRAGGCRCGRCWPASPRADGSLPHPATREYMYPLARVAAGGSGFSRTPCGPPCTAAAGGAT